MSQFGRDPLLLAQQPGEGRPLLTAEAIEWMLIAAARDEQFFRQVASHIDISYFRPGTEDYLRAAFLILERVWRDYGGATEATLSAVLPEVLQSPDLPEFSEESLRRLVGDGTSGGLLQSMVSPELELRPPDLRLAQTVLSQMICERSVIPALTRVVSVANAEIPHNLGDVIRASADVLNRSDQLTAPPIVPVAPQFGSDIAAPADFVLTGVPFIDAVLGGQRRGDCNGLLGPTGAGKTTLAVQMSVQMAQQCWMEAQLSGGQPECVVYFSAEESGRRLLPRIWSVFFRIPRRKLERLVEGNLWGNLTTRENLDAYEREMQAGQEEMLSESERYELFRPQLEQCYRLLDISGSDEHPHAGTGGIDELAGCLRALDAPIRSVFIDYAGLVCSRYLDAQGRKPEEQRILMARFGDECRRKLAEEFNCTVWVIHQLRGAAGAFAPSKLPKHTDAADSKDFAVNLSLCGCLGTPDPTTGCRRFNWSKIRYSAIEQAPPITFRLHEEFAMMVDVTDDFVVDNASGQIVPASEVPSPASVRRTRRARSVEF